MLNLNKIPSNLIQFVADFDLQYPDKEKAKQWWDELNQFLETFEFPIPEMKTKFYKDHHAKLDYLIKALDQESTPPITGYLILKTPMELLIINLLGEEFEYMDHVELTTRRDRIYSELKLLSIPEIVEKVNSYITITPKGNDKLFQELLTLKPTSKQLEINLEEFLDNGATKGHYTLLALGCARIEILANCDDEDLKAKIAHHYRQRPFPVANLTSEEMADRGYQASLIRLDYVYNLVLENRVIRKIDNMPIRVEGLFTFDEDTVKEIKELSLNREEFLNSKYPGKLYSHVSNAVKWYSNHLRMEKLELSDEYNYAISNLTVNEHYRIASEKLKLRVKDLKVKVINARNRTTHTRLISYFNVIAINLDTYLENLTNAKGKRSFRHTLGLVNALECTVVVVTSLDDAAMLKAIETLASEHLETTGSAGSKNVLHID